jgi:hypothetical protein
MNEPALRIQDPDGFYEYLLDAHAGLSAEQSAQLNAALVLLLANRLGDDEALRACVDAAARSVRELR